MTKRKAFATHLGISLVIFLIILFFIVFEWYPPPFFSSDGGWQGIRIIVGVDLVLGPLLTLIVFKPGKPGLKFDMTVIGIIQASALTWGIWTIHHERPIAAVFVENYFVPVTYYQIENTGMTRDMLRGFGDKAPYWIYCELPTDDNALQKVRLEALRTGRTLFKFTEYYKPMDAKALQIIKARSLKMSEWVSDKPAEKQRYQMFLQRHHNGENLLFLPWHARENYEIIAMNEYNGRYVGTLDIAPPKPMQESIPGMPSKKAKPAKKASKD